MYVRRVKKGDKVYLYYYKSQRIGDKVKSIYVGKVLEKPKKTRIIKKEIQDKQKIIKNTETVNNLIEFDNLLFEINRLITLKDLRNSINIYNKMLDIYSKLDLQTEDKEKIFNKLNSSYNELVDLGEEQNIKF